MCSFLGMGVKLPASSMREIFRLDSETGRIYWMAKTARNVVIGREAGTGNSGCRRSVVINRYRYATHHIVFAITHDRWPSEIDHINGDESDNRPENLREATRSENNCNRRIQVNNISGFKGVYWHKKSQMWQAKIRIRGKVISLKYHHTPEGAAKAYAEGAAKYHGEFARLQPEALARRSAA